MTNASLQDVAPLSSYHGQFTVRNSQMIYSRNSCCIDRHQDPMRKFRLRKENYSYAHYNKKVHIWYFF
jgi:hypothetical protein